MSISMLYTVRHAFTIRYRFAIQFKRSDALAEDKKRPKKALDSPACAPSPQKKEGKQKQAARNGMRLIYIYIYKKDAQRRKSGERRQIGNSLQHLD